jgi:putative Mg2+ transporter-C (MgtC) family protein
MVDFWRRQAARSCVEHGSIQEHDLDIQIFDSNWQQQLQVIASVAMATVLGALVGTERELADRPAGLRTHAILAAGSCLLVGLGDVLLEHFAANAPSGVLRADPIRIVEAIVTGTAFLGAGTIFRHRGNAQVEGLTTAASLLLVAAIGIAVGLGQLLIAITVTALTLVLLRVVRSLFAKRKSKVRE